MALTVSKAVTTFGDKKVSYGSITFDSSYPTGGEAITAAQLGLSKLSHLQVGHANTTATRLITWNRSTSAAKLLVYTALSTEATNASDQSTVIVSYIAIGL